VDDAVISVRGLRKRYGSMDAVAGIDLEIRRGEIFAFLGPNGAGKTTTVEILEGFRISISSNGPLSGLLPLYAPTRPADRINAASPTAPARRSHGPRLGGSRGADYAL
jgi:ABC-type uncharacterized transport system ATPase subunit